jgi:Protein  of unknown function (DUF3018)
MEVAMTDVAKRVRKHREKMKAAGLKPVTIWVPDVNTPEFKARVAREIELINADPESERVMEEMLALSDFSDWK